MRSKAYPIVTAPVLIPYAPDCEYKYGEEILPPDKIQRLANSFNDYKIIDLQHEYTKRILNKLKPIQRGKLLKSYISTEKLFLKGLDGFVREYPPGTWIISVEITDPEAMRLYHKGELTGFSVTVKEKEHADAITEFLSQKDYLLPEEVIQSEKDFTKKPKRILMKDVKNPVAFTVSLVKQPCVYGAKFCRKSCLIVNENKLKENNIVSLKEKIKMEINNFIDGMDVEDESIKSDEESEKEEIAESEKEDKLIECEKCGGRHLESEKCNGPKVKQSSKSEEESEKADDEPVVEEEEEKQEEEEEEAAESEKEVLYIAQDEVENIIKATLQRYAEEIEMLVFDGIQEALDDYIFQDSMKSEEEQTEEESIKEEVEVEESQKEYATPEMVESLVESQFESFKSDIMENIKKAQSESIKSYSKAIKPSDDGLTEETAKTYTPKMNERDVYGRRIRK